MTSLVWPSISLRWLPLAERDLLILSGTEPNWNWKRLGNELSHLAVELGVTEQVSLGGIPWAWPHTRPVQIIATASDRAHLPDSDERPEGLLRVPSAAVSTIEYMIGGTGIPTVGFYARVPQYVGVEYPAAALALIRRLERHVGVDLPIGDLEDQANAQRASWTRSRPRAATSRAWSTSWKPWSMRPNRCRGKSWPPRSSGSSEVNEETPPTAC